MITFDEYGISSHPNHIATYQGVIRSLSRYFQLYQHLIPCIKLETTNSIRKFLGPFDLLWSLIFWNDILIINWNFIKTIQLMQAHTSQFVWYRKLFILFSRYTYMNTFNFVKIDLSRE